MAESLQERQSNELEALTSMFSDQLTNNNESQHLDDDVWKPLDVVITVFPEGNLTDLQNIRVDLHVKASEKYPNEIPLIKLKNAIGVPSNYLTHLEKQLYEFSKKNVGEVMIYELVQYLQNFLSLYNKPQYSSFYEEMIFRKQQVEFQEFETKKQEIELTKQLVYNEMSKKKLALKKECQMLKNKTGNKFESLIDEDEENQCHLKERNIVDSQFKKDIERKNPLHGDYGTNDNNILFEYNFSSTSRLYKEFIILDWLGQGAFGNVLKVKNKLDDCLYAIKFIELKKKNLLFFKKITREVKLLSRLNHENVVRYFNSWIESDTGQDETIKNEKNKTADKLSLDNISYGWQLSNFVEENNENSSDDNDWISFVNVSDSKNVSLAEDINSNDELEDVKNNEINQFMYIQMEFCEKSTLRNAVDNGLYKNPNRVWRLLREIIEGLSYIHQQGIIHRDLKPVNIFIDSDDHVKIGDFGLATNIHRHIPECDSTNIQDVFMDSSQTGNIGTTLYIAPELNNSKALYNEKVDIYSLGIIFFEMCHKPFETQMERIKVLSDLRMYECILPMEYLKSAEPNQKYIIRWLLHHDPCKRPNSTELLQSQYIPPPKLKDTELHELIRNTLSNSKSKNYKHLIDSCFNQKMTAVDDITFNLMSGKNILLHGRLDKIIKIVKDVFQIHGGVWLGTPLLMPYNSNDENSVPLMARWGGLTCIPYNLRIPFARFIAHNPTISNLKRYSIDRVFRQRKVLGVHPRELYEAAFDIISSSQEDLIAEAEILSIATDIFIKLKNFNHKNCTIRLNHISLVQGILMYSGIEKARHLEFCKYFAKLKQNDFNQEQIVDLEDLGFANHQIKLAINFFSTDHSLNNIIEKCHKITVRKSKCGIFSRNALQHLKTLISYIESLNFSVVIAPGLMNLSQYYSGLIFEIVYHNKSKKNFEQFDVIAAGGCYNNLITSFRKNVCASSDVKMQTAIGISFSLDKLTSLFQTESSRIDMILCSSNNNNAIAEVKFHIAKNLWNMGIKTLISNVEQTLEQIHDYCQDVYGVDSFAMLKDPKSIIYRNLNENKFQDKFMNIPEFIELMRHKSQLKPREDLTSVTSQTNSYVKSDSRTNSECQHINIVFFTEEKLTANVKRRYETQISNAISKTLQKLSPKICVEILALNVDVDLIIALGSLFDLSNIENDIVALIKRFSHHKKDLNKLCNYMVDMKQKSTDIIFVFYTLKGNVFKLMIC